MRIACTFFGRDRISRSSSGVVLLLLRFGLVLVVVFKVNLYVVVRAGAAATRTGGGVGGVVRAWSGIGRKLAYGFRMI